MITYILKYMEILISGLISIYAILWAIPGIIIILVVGRGSYKYIIYIDRQLAKDLDKYYDEQGYMKSRYQTWASIQTRFIHYCIAYPFIYNRINENVMKFKVFMWFNALGIWAWISMAILGTIGSLFS
ncbi:TPA: hypothetical protein ACX6PQ_000613 [Photobacterium damselae]